MSAIARALVSVSDKAGIVEFARALHALGIEILSTGGTAGQLREAGVPVVEVSSYTGFPEMMDGRVKTLHPRIHGGLLARRDTDSEAMREHGIAGIDLLVVNLYPFERTVANPDCDLATAIENIDIGGPAMLRAAAKNHAWVTVVVDAGDHATVLEELRAGGAVTPATRFRLATKAFEHTARYDGAIASYLGARDGTESPPAAFPRTLNLQYAKSQEMRYGENPHQGAAFYVEHARAQASVATARQLQGKALSFNNVADTDAALECVKSFEEPACVIVKHANPCGVAVAGNIRDAYDRAFTTDPTSAFGGIIAFNRPLDAETAAAIVERQFVEVIVAPRIEDAALAPLASKENVRVLECGELPATPCAAFDFKRVTGGLLVQDRDIGTVAGGELEVVTRRLPTEAELRDLLFAWKVVKFVKSNAIVYCRDGMTIGIGAGQMSRVYSAKIAGIKAPTRGSRFEARCSPPTRSSRSATASTRPPRPESPRSSSRADRCATTRSSRRRTSTAWRWCSPACGTFDTDGIDMAQELEGEWVMGWPDRKRARIMPSKDAEGRTIHARSPVLDLEGVLTPTDAYYIVAQLDMPDPVHPDDFSFSVAGLVEHPGRVHARGAAQVPRTHGARGHRVRGQRRRVLRLRQGGLEHEEALPAPCSGRGRSCAPEDGFG